MEAAFATFFIAFLSNTHVNYNELVKEYHRVELESRLGGVRKQDFRWDLNENDVVLRRYDAAVQTAAVRSISFDCPRDFPELYARVKREVDPQKDYYKLLESCNKMQQKRLAQLADRIKSDKVPLREVNELIEDESKEFVGLKRFNKIF